MPTAVSLTNNPLTSILWKTLGSCPIVTKILFLLSLFSLLPTLLPLSFLNDGLVDATALCVAAVRSSPVNSIATPLAQLVVSPFVHTDMLSGLIASFAIFQLGSRIEQQRGSLFLAHLFFLLLLLTQSAHLLFVSFIASDEWRVQLASRLYFNVDAIRVSENFRIPIYGARDLTGMSQYSWKALMSYSIPTQVCSVNNWAILFALLVFEANKLTKDRWRHVFLIPTALPSRAVPLVLLVVYQFWFGVQLHTLIGCGMGYLVSYLPFLTLPTWMLEAAEGDWCRYWDTFISVTRAGKMQPWRHYVREEQPKGSAASPTNRAVSATGSINASSNPNRSAFPVNRKPTPGGGIGGEQSPGGWRRMDVSSSSSSSSSNSSSSSDGEDQPSGSAAPAAQRPPPAVRTLSPVNSSSALAGSDADDRSKAILAANVAKILEVPSAYPTNAGNQ